MGYLIHQVEVMLVAVNTFAKTKMKNINHRNIRLISENLTAYDTTISCELPLPKFILDTKGKLFQKAKTIFEPGHESRTTYSEVLVTNLSNVEVPAVLEVDTEYSVVK